MFFCGFFSQKDKSCKYWKMIWSVGNYMYVLYSVLLIQSRQGCPLSYLWFIYTYNKCFSIIIRLRSMQCFAFFMREIKMNSHVHFTSSHRWFLWYWLETFWNSYHYNIMSVSVHCLDNETQCSFYEIHLYIVVICFCQYEIKMKILLLLCTWFIMNKSRASM